MKKWLFPATCVVIFLHGLSTFSWGQLGSSRDVFERKFAPASSDRNRKSDTQTYQFSGRLKVEVHFENDRAQKIRVFGSRMNPSDIRKLLVAASPQGPKVKKTDKWREDKRLTSIFPAASQTIARSKFVQTGVRRELKGGETKDAYLVRKLNGIETGRRYLGRFQTRPYVQTRPVGFNRPYLARQGARRTIYSMRVPAKAIATCDFTVDSDDGTYTQSLVITFPKYFFESALENRKNLFESPASPLPSRARVRHEIPYDRAVASFMSPTEQQLLVKSQFLQILLCAIDDSQIPFKTIQPFIDDSAPNELAKALSKRLARASDQAKFRRIEVMAMIKSKRSIATLKRLSKDELFTRQAQRALRAIQNR